MKKKLNAIREKAIKVRESLTYDKADDRSHIGKIDRIIRGTVIAKWLYLLASIFFPIYAVFFTYMMYPKVKFIIIELAFAVGGYAVCLIGGAVQIKLYERTIAKVQSAR